MAKSAKRNYETPAILSDSPLTQHDESVHFHFDEFAVTLARLIADKDTRTPLTIGVSGAWGSGKTTLLRRARGLSLAQAYDLIPDNAHPMKMDLP